MELHRVGPDLVAEQQQQQTRESCILNNLQVIIEQVVLDPHFEKHTAGLATSLIKTSIKTGVSSV